MKGFGLFLTLLVVGTIVIAGIFSFQNVQRCEERGGVMLQGQCIKGERIPL